MQHFRLLPSSSGTPLPERFVSRLASFADLFTRPTWSNVLVLVAGVVLAPGRRTVTAALRILGRDRDPAFCTFHRILNRAAWSSRAAAGRLLILLIKAFVTSSAPVVIGLDDTIERLAEVVPIEARDRRRFRIMRPARVDMRARKPCLRFRRRTFGW